MKEIISDKEKPRFRSFEEARWLRTFRPASEDTITETVDTTPTEPKTKTNKSTAETIVSSDDYEESETTIKKPQIVPPAQRVEDVLLLLKAAGDDYIFIMRKYIEITPSLLTKDKPKLFAAISEVEKMLSELHREELK